MDHVIYTAMGGARHSMENQAVVANNLANASTPGFKAQLSAMRAVPINGETLPTRTLTVASTPGSDQRQGTMNYTGRPMDVALSDNGYIWLFNLKMVRKRILETAILSVTLMAC